MEEPPIKRVRVSGTQIKTIVEAMESNPNLNKSALSKTYSSKQRYADWSALCEVLNKDGHGGVKSVDKWQKCWSDYKNEVRKRRRGLRYSRRPYMTPIELRILKLMGLEPPSDVDSTGDQSLKLEISSVESVTDDPMAEIQLEESTSSLTDSETSNPLTETPTVVRTVKIEPEEVPKRLLEANDAPHGDIVALVPVSSVMTLVPGQTPVPSFINLFGEQTPVSSVVKLVREQTPVPSVRALVPSQAPVSNVVTLVREQTPVPNVTTLVPSQAPVSSVMTLVSEQTPVSGLSSVNKINKADSTDFEKSSAKCLVEAQNAAAEASQSVAKALEAVAESKNSQNAVADALKLVSKELETVTENQSNQSTIAEALKSVSKALETMAENQKVQLAIEERRTALFEKLIDHFCSQKK